MSEPEHGNMIRDERDEWPSNEPAYSFDIEMGSPYPEATAHILFVCPNGKRCAVMLGPQALDRTPERQLCIWAWNGDRDRPTLTPSINCIAEKDGKPTGGCGWHGFITNGVMLF